MRIKINNFEKSSNYVLYDGFCLFCQQSKNIIETLDWFKQINLVNLYDNEKITDLKLPIKPTDELIKEIHLINTESRKVLKGFYACRKIGLVMPLTFPFAIFLYIPGAPFIGNKFYKWIAKNRK